LAVVSEFGFTAPETQQLKVLQHETDVAMIEVSDGPVAPNPLVSCDVKLAPPLVVTRKLPPVAVGTSYVVAKQ
jgi:hypothetical protein